MGIRNSIIQEAKLTQSVNRLLVLSVGMLFLLAMSAPSTARAQKMDSQQSILLAQEDFGDGAPPPPPPEEPENFEEPPPPEPAVDDGVGFENPPAPQDNSVPPPPPPPPGSGVSEGNTDRSAAPAIPVRQIPPGEELVTIDFPEPVAIKDIIKAVAQWTGKNFILGQGVSSSARVAIISPQQVTKEEAYQAFLSALNVAGFTTVDTGRVVKIIPTRQATSSNIKTFYGASWAPMTDEIITQIIPLTYIDAQTVARQLRSILRESNAVPFPTTNSLIVSDTGHKIRRLLEIILLLDVKGNQPQVAIVPIVFMDANDVAKKIQEIFGSSGRRGGSLYLQKVIVDERSNSCILIGPPRGLDDVVRLIKRLDRELEDQVQQSQIHVRPLEYADATKLASTLQALAQGTDSNRNAALRRIRRPPTTPNGERAEPEAPEGASVADLGNVKITADAATNSLILQGSQAAFNELDTIIRKLDKRKAQLFVEADIIDVNVGKNIGLRISGFAGHADDPNVILPYGWKPGVVGAFSALSSSSSLSSTQAAGLLSGLPQEAVFGVLSRKPIKIAENLSLTPGAFIFALKKDSNSNVLQTPSMLVADNEEAEFEATERENIFVLQTNAQTGISSPKVESLDATLSLKIKPQISQSDVVNMDLVLKADSFGRRGSDNRPEQTNKRSFNTKVSVQDSQTIVISGLQRDIEIEGEEKVPLLGDIPIIGWLFRDTSFTRQKTNLMIFLTPYVVRDSNDLSRIYDKKMQDQKEFLEKFYGEDFREKEVFERLPNRADGRVPPPRVSRGESGNDQSQSQDGQSSGSKTPGTVLPEDPDFKGTLPSEDPDPIVVPTGEAGGGDFSGGDVDTGGGADGGAPPPPPPPPPPPGDSTE